MAPDLMDGMTLVAAPTVGGLLKPTCFVSVLFRLLREGLAHLALDLFGQSRRKYSGR